MKLTRAGVTIWPASHDTGSHCLLNSDISLAIVTDAWTPQVNGVINKLHRTRDELIRLG
jgi:hypothetical protein